MVQPAAGEHSAVCPGGTRSAGSSARLPFNGVRGTREQQLKVGNAARVRFFFQTES